MLKFENKEFRNLQEQVLKNAVDIQVILQGDHVLNQFGIKVIGRIDTPEELPAVDDFTGEYGDAYAVGTTAPYSLYIWTRNIENETDGWFNIGLFPQSGPQGIQGPAGETGPQGQRGNKVVSFSEEPPTIETNMDPVNGYIVGDTWINAVNGNLYILKYVKSIGDNIWTLIGNIRGPQGIQGEKGLKGDTGATGPQGPQGPQGDPGDIVKIIDILASTSELPLPTTVDHTTGYLVGTSAPYHLYIILAGDGQEDQKWFDTGAFGDFQLVNITVPLTTTQGTLTGDQLSILQNSPYNMINLNGEYFRLNDDKTSAGYLVYSHIGSTDGNANPYSKLITITVLGGSWVLTKDRIATYDELTGYATEQWVLDKNYLTQHQSLENYYTKTEVNNIVSGYYTKGEVDNIVGDINTILDTINGEVI